MNQQASVIMEGDFSDYTLKELLEVASLCRQLIEVSLSSGSQLQGQLLLKAGQLLEAKLLSSAQQGAQAFQSLLDSSFDQFRVVQLKRQPWARDPIGRLIDLMHPPAPAAPVAPQVATSSTSSTASSATPATSPVASTGSSATTTAPSATTTAPSAPVASFTPVALKTSKITPPPVAPASSNEHTLVAPAPKESTISAAAPTKAVTQTSPVNAQVTSKPPQSSLGRPSTPALLSKPLSATPLPKPPVLSSAPAPSLSELDDHSATSVFSGAELSELVTLIGVIEQQRATLGEIDSECKQLGQYAQQLYAQLQHQGEQLTRQSSRGEQLASHQSSLLQQLHEAARHLNETQQAQSASLRQLLGYAQQSQGALETLRQSVQALDTQRAERPEASSAPVAQTPDLMGGAVGSQLLLELARGREDKQSGHLTPLMVVSLFIQVISLILISVLVVKMLF